MDLYRYLADGYSWSWTIVDHRVDGFLLMSSAKPIVLLMAAYYAMVYYGPKYMEKRKPWNMRWFLVIYNAFVVLLNLNICLQILIGVINRRYNWLCDIPDLNDTHPEEMRIVRMVHLYTVSKVIEWLDTFCFVVRKKNDQLTFLHVYHHSTMLPFTWLGCRWLASGLTCFPMMLNSFIHVVMYSYYALSACGPIFQKYLWWKKYLTILQLAQFALGFCHINLNFIFGCQFTRWLLYVSFFYAISYLTLFGLFYKSTYIQKRKDEKLKLSESKSEDAQNGVGQLSKDFGDGSRRRAVISAKAVAG